MEKTERGKLDVLLNYWIEHNKEHGEEYKEWTEKVKNLKRLKFIITAWKQCSR